MTGAAVFAVHTKRFHPFQNRILAATTSVHLSQWLWDDDKLEVRKYRLHIERKGLKVQNPAGEYPNDPNLN